MLYLGDCLEVMKELKDKSVDMVLADLPYGTTVCKWDEVILMEPLWEQYNRITKGNAAIVLFASQPFAATLIVSNIQMFKYEWIWEKERPTNPLNANRQALKYHENILVFYRNQCIFNPQLRLRDPKNKRNNSRRNYKSAVNNDFNSDEMNQSGLADYIKPKSVIQFNMERGLHPTQKPVALLEYLIKTYTNEGDTVLDNVMGSGSTGVACKNLNRKFIGIEKEEKYFKIAEQRINGLRPA